MRHHHRLCAFALLAVLSIGAAQAAPSFGASSHRLGGDESTSARAATKDERPLSLLEMALSLAGVKLSTGVEPVVGDRVVRGANKSKECDNAEAAEVAKAEPEDGGEGATSKGRARSGEPVYLAF